MRARGINRVWVAAAGIATVACLALDPLMAQAGERFWREGSQLTEPSSDLVQLNQSLTQLVTVVQPAVVQIGVEKGEREPLPPDHPPVPEERPERPGVGSGFIVSQDGYILTNHHVVAKAQAVDVELYDGRTLPAKVVGKDRRTDLALLKIDAEDSLPVLSLGDSDQVKIGELVLAVGNPFGLEHSVSVGVVSRKGHGFGRFGFFDDYIQTDASINPGNSGGPLVNIRGEVVGINTAIIPRQRIGFAIPINLAKSILLQLRERGEVAWGFLGVGIQDVNGPLAQALGMDGKKGALVTNILPGMAAERAGLKRGDVILEFDGTAITDVRSLQQGVARVPVGTNVTIKILRRGEVQSVSAVVGEFDEDFQVVARPEKSPEPIPNEVLGLTLAEVTPEKAKEFKLNVEKGVVVTDVIQGSSGARAGVRPGDVVTEVDHAPVKTVKEVHRALKGWTRPTHLVLIHRGDNFFYVAIGKRS